METGGTGIHDNIQNAITAIIFSKHTNASFGIFFSICLCKKKFCNLSLRVPTCLIAGLINEILSNLNFKRKLEIMKQLKPLALLVLGGIVTLAACKKDASTADEEISQAVKDQVYAAGFGTDNIQKIDEGYLVEGDIILTSEFLSSSPANQTLRTGTEEQYHTTNLVTGLPRAISLSLSPSLANKPGYSQALAIVRDRYNALGLTLSFIIAAPGKGDINYVDGHGNFLASAGFPGSNGTPFGTIKVNTKSIGIGTSSTFINSLGTIMAHEAGHCIGFRHSDFLDRSVSCGGSHVNEGASTVGAILIPNTPAAPDGDLGSWMLSCIGSGQNRPFTEFDKAALDFLY